MKPDKNANPDIRTLTITDLAFGGDGIARDVANGDTVFVPYGLPGDVVRARIMEVKDHKIWARILDVVEPSRERAQPPCAHFFDCGGCMLQHLRLDAYQAWKVETVTARLTKAGLKPKTVHPLIAIDPKTRRRATFAARRENGKITLGFNRNHSDHIVNIQDCAVIVDDIMSVLPNLRILMNTLMTDMHEADVSVTLLDHGLDVLITAPVKLDLLKHESIAEFVQNNNVARLSLRAHDRAGPDVVLQPKSPCLTIGGQCIEPAPGSFLQPSIQGEQALIDAVVRGVTGAKNIVDLFSGLGTFTFPLARAARVHAVDIDGPGIRAMTAVVGSLPLTSAARNLYKEPVRADDLKKYDAIVFDPPRAGAKGQAPHIAASGVPVVVAVSCNPTTFVTDCAPLIDAGYTFTDLTIVDQFIWSAHVEIVGVFSKKN